MDIQRDTPPRHWRYVVAGGAVIILLASAVALGRVRSAVATFERGTLSFDTVTVGEMLRDVRGPGSLVAEHTRILVAETGGRIESLPVHAGQNVDDTTTLVVLSNPDVERASLEIRQSLIQARVALAQLRSSLAQQRVMQTGLVAQLRTQQREAARAAAVQDTLAKGWLASRNDVTAAHDRLQELTTRFELEQRRLVDMQESEAEQIRLHKDQVAGLERLVEDQQSRVSAMRVTAGEDGQIQSLGNPQLELGQWVTPGSELARVTTPGRLKAVIRIPDTQANEVVAGQRAIIDTHDGSIPGRVARVDPTSRSGAVAIEVTLNGPLPRSARADLGVDGTIIVERLPSILHVGRPAYGGQESIVRMFRVVPNTGDAVRVDVRFGRASVSTVEVKEGLTRGDSVVISDMAPFVADTRIRLK
jgi:multidrug efflux pump subunit AcrA (membrane-fusion protein)